MESAKNLLGSIRRKQSQPSGPQAVKVNEEDAAQVESEYNIRKITELQGRFAGGETLLIPGRVFIREGMLLKQCRKELKQRHFVLFNDTLVYGSIIAKGHYTKQVILPLNELSFTGDVHFLPSVYDGDPSVLLGDKFDPNNAFQINHRSKSFHVVAQNATDKANWLANLQKYVERASEGGGARMDQVAAVWVPDTAVGTCMVCKTAKFGPFNRKHHCRNCGKVVCHPCSTTTKVLTHISSKPQRICDECVQVFSMGGGRHQRPSLVPLGTVGSTAGTAGAPAAAAAPSDADAQARAKKFDDYSEGDMSDSDGEADAGSKAAAVPAPAPTTEPAKAEHPAPAVESPAESPSTAAKNPVAPPRRKKWADKSDKSQEAADAHVPEMVQVKSIDSPGLSRAAGDQLEESGRSTFCVNESVPDAPPEALPTAEKILGIRVLPTLPSKSAAAEDFPQPPPAVAKPEAEEQSAAAPASETADVTAIAEPAASSSATAAVPSEAQEDTSAAPAEDAQEASAGTSAAATKRGPKRHKFKKKEDGAINETA
eukprot:Opistho-1_new@76877